VKKVPGEKILCLKLKDRMTALKAGGALPVYLTTTDMVPAHDLKEEEK
jgi:hypothetical protein